MERAAEFEKVSFSQFEKDWKKNMPGYSDHEICQIYEEIQLPARATAGSAGYDFHAPVRISLKAHEQLLLPTGIRARMKDGWVLMLFPRSSLGFRYRMQLNNTVGIIDSDYYHAENEGHIMCRISCDSYEKKELVVEKGAGFVQGIFLPFGITETDEESGERKGGIGSTDRKEKE